MAKSNYTDVPSITSTKIPPNDLEINSKVSNVAKMAVYSGQSANDDSYQPQDISSLEISQFTDIVKDGRIFGVSFIKRTTGELRTMTCRLGVKKFLRGGELAYSPAKKHLLTVFDMVAKGYRMIPLDAIQRVACST